MIGCRVRVTGAAAREVLLNRQIACQQYAYQFGVDRPEEAGWKWPY
jgi:xylulose-5-phosphate/fructose-6-phosphate phosphoketolase